MRILMISRATLYTVKGGDTVQIMQTAEALRMLGHTVDIILSNERKIEYNAYHLIHFFNIIRPADIMYHTHKSNLPYVVSTVYVDYSTWESYDKGRPIWYRWLGSDAREYVKAIARMLVNRESIMSFRYLLTGHRASVKHVIKHAAMLLPNSESEYQRLAKHYKINAAYRTVVNGADTDFFKCDDEILAQKNNRMVLCAGRIEGRKNQLNLIRALNDTEFNLYIIGKAAPNHKDYYNQCKTIAAGNIHFVDECNREELRRYYHQAKVHVLPSWFETTGLSSLEALFCGCNIVVSDYGDTKEYFPTDGVLYCNPGDTDDILKQVRVAAGADFNKAQADFLKSKFNWHKAGLQTEQAYKEVLRAL